VVGGLVGLLSGYVGGKTDLLAQRLMDVMQALPILVLALVLAAALGPSLTNTILAISVVIAPRAARVVRASVLSIREFTYVESARALGVGHARVAFRHILPNTFGPFIVLVTAQLGGAILVEAALSFLGVGVKPPTPSWGSMLSDAVNTYSIDPEFMIVPGAALFITVLAFNLLGDGLRDALDPRAGR
jgi:peptide/nickel transport system permease protein